MTSSAANMRRSLRPRKAARPETTREPERDLLPTVSRHDSDLDQPKRVLRQRQQNNYTSFFDEALEAQEQSKRPSRILHTTTIKQAHHAKYNRNAQNSPLLKLPSEIRNRIWVYAFGGCLVHIWATDDDDDDLLDNGAPTDKLQLRRSVCTAETRDEEEAVLIKAKRTNGHDDWCHRHRECKHSSRILSIIPSLRSPFTVLDQLRACRQIHREAALLPYQENTFQFCYSVHLRLFRDRLVPAQLRAIQSISISIFWNEDWATLNETSEKQIKRKLPKLNTLTVFAEFLYGEWFEDDEGGIAEALRMFQPLDLETVNVAAYVDADVYQGESDKGDEEGPNRAQLNEWAESIEEMLKKKFVAEKKSMKRKLKDVDEGS